MASASPGLTSTTVTFSVVVMVMVGQNEGGKGTKKEKSEMDDGKSYFLPQQPLVLGSTAGHVTLAPNPLEQ